MFHRKAVEDILGDDGFQGALEGMVEEQVASSSDDVVDENSRSFSDEDNGDMQVTDATPSSSSTSITARSSSSPESPSNCLHRVMTGSCTPSSAAGVLQDIPGFSLSGWRILDSSGRRIGIIRCIAGNYLEVDCDISGTRRNASLTSTSR